MLFKTSTQKKGRWDKVIDRREIISFFKKKWDGDNNIAKSKAFELYFYALKEYCEHYALVCRYVNEIVEGVLLETEQKTTFSEHIMDMNCACKYTRNFKAILLEKKPEYIFPGNIGNHIFGEELCKTGTFLEIKDGEIVSGKENIVPEKLKALQKKVSPDTLETFEYTRYLQTLLTKQKEAI